MPDYPNLTLEDGMTPQEHRVARLYASGMAPKAIAGMTRLSAKQLYGMLRRKVVRERVTTLLNQLEQSVIEELREAEFEAVQVLRASLYATQDDGVDWVARQKAAMDFLNRAGKRGSPEAKTRSEGIVAHLSGQELAALLARAAADPTMPKEMRIEALKRLSPGEDNAHS